MSKVTLREAFDIKPGEVISLAGAGGKTTLMYALAHELAASGNVITTTTTKILSPLAAESPMLIVEADENEAIRLIEENINHFKHLTVASEKIVSGKLKGIGPGLAARIAGLPQVSFVIIEADGAAHRSLKAPNATEPVFVPNTSLVIPVVGIDATGCPLNEEYVFRAEIAAKILGLPMGTILSTEDIACLITNPNGIAKGSPQRARIVPFINKVDSASLSQGRDIARRIIKKNTIMKKVVLGQAREIEPVVEVITA